MHRSVMSKVRTLLAKWPDRATIASDLGLPYPTVGTWYRTGSVPQWYFTRLLDSAADRGIPLTAEELARAHHDDRLAADAAKAAKAVAG